MLLVSDSARTKETLSVMEGHLPGLKEVRTGSGAPPGAHYPLDALEVADESHGRAASPFRPPRRA